MTNVWVSPRIVETNAKRSQLPPVAASSAAPAVSASQGLSVLAPQGHARALAAASSRRPSTRTVTVGAACGGRREGEESGDRAGDDSELHAVSHPFPRGRSAWRSEGGLLASGPSLSAPSRPADAQWPALDAALRWAPPVTVAGPRRIRTGFPDHRPWFGEHGITDEQAMTVNLTRIYTRLGDGGETHLGDMSRVPKTHERIEAYGTVDELNAQLGVALAQGGLNERTAQWLQRVQNDLFDVGADISVPEGGERERLRVVPGADDVARGGLRRGERRAAGAEVLRPPRRHARRGAAARLPHRLPPRGAAHDRLRRGRQRGVRALPQPAQRPAVHPLARGERGRRRAPVGAGTLPLSTSAPAAIASAPKTNVVLAAA